MRSYNLPTLPYTSSCNSVPTMIPMLLSRTSLTSMKAPFGTFRVAARGLYSCCSLLDGPCSCSVVWVSDTCLLVRVPATASCWLHVAGGPCSYPNSHNTTVQLVDTSCVVPVPLLFSATILQRLFSSVHPTASIQTSNSCIDSSTR